jgi:hypothetical protein
MLSNSTRALALGCAGSVMLGCTEPDRNPVAPADQPAPTVVKPGGPGAASDRTLYQVRLAALGDFRARGVVLIEVVGGHLTVTVHAAGLVPGENIPQHIHVNPTCNPGGGVLINLDENLTVGAPPGLPPEAPGIGDAYPTANDGGVVKYYASRPLSELLQAVNTHFNLTLGSVDELLTWLDLENRNAHMHIPEPPFTPVNCGEVERLN